MQDRFHQKLERFRVAVARTDPLLPLSLLGVTTGLLAGLVIIAFRMLIETTQGAFLPGGDPENYEGLSTWSRLLLPIFGGLIVGIAFQYLAKESRQVGVIHVAERLGYHQGKLPLKNAVVQFFSAAICIISGHSVGREGPSVHLGAASGSQLGHILRLPHNYLRTLVGCGVAAAIAASFNTPLAGVIFAMEVVMMEYTVAGFLPVILAAVSATSLINLIYGNAPAFTVPQLHLGSIAELPFIFVMGITTGILSVLFINLVLKFNNLGADLPTWTRATLAGFIIGICAIIAPQIMSIGYDTVNQALLGEFGLLLLGLILLFKLLTTSAGIGLGLPAGLIGPTLVIGAAAGGLMGGVFTIVTPNYEFSVGFYALMGMGAMMAATLKAPLAALIAMLELTGNPNIIFPGMLVVVAAVLTSSKVFKQESIFISLLKARGLDYRHDPIAQSLGNIGVASVMNTNFNKCKSSLTYVEAESLLDNNPHWLVVQEDLTTSTLLPGADLALYLKNTTIEETPEIDLMKIPATRLQLVSIDLRATLQEALDNIGKTNAEGCFVTQMTAPMINKTYGIITRSDIDSSYKYHS